MCINKVGARFMEFYASMYTLYLTSKDNLVIAATLSLIHNTVSTELASPPFPCDKETLFGSKLNSSLMFLLARQPKVLSHQITETTLG